MRRLLAVIGFLVLLIGCGGDDAGSGGNSGGVTIIGGESLTFGSSVTSHAIQLSGSVSWSAKSDDNCKNWCYPFKASGNSDKIVLWVSPNITDKARSGKVTVQLGGKKQEISVSQPAFTGDLDTYDYHLPVVFHVMYHNKSDKKQNPDKSQFTKILDAVNKLYAANNMHIVFEMAKYDDKGEELEEPGIIRKQVDFSEYDANEFLQDKDYADDVLNLKKYINIFVFRFAQASSDATTLGLTTLPIVPTAYPLEHLVDTDAANEYAYLTTPFGVCINNEAIEEWQDEKTVNPKYIVATVAHEIGHYIGLLHTFSEIECEEDDGCEDTPISDYNNYIEYITDYIAKQQAAGKKITIEEVAKRTDCKTGEEFIADNILDYAYTIGNVFTADQKKRTRHVLKYGALTPGPKLIDYNTTGIVPKSTNKSSQRAAASRPGMVQTDPCPKVPVNRLPQIGLK
jgi:zinc-dependent metalloproteinase lipoprotein